MNNQIEPRAIRTIRAYKLIRHFGIAQPTSYQLFIEAVGERLYAKLERPELAALVQALHLLGHERLMDQFAFGISRIHYLKRLVNHREKPESKTNNHYKAVAATL